jgi:hypothetical protein
VLAYVQKQTVADLPLVGLDTPYYCSRSCGTLNPYAQMSHKHRWYSQHTTKLLRSIDTSFFHLSDYFTILVKIAWQQLLLVDTHIIATATLGGGYELVKGAAGSGTATKTREKCA